LPIITLDILEDYRDDPLVLSAWKKRYRIKLKQAGDFYNMPDKTVFEKAFEILMVHEGGYSNDPEDSGGETKFGISSKSYPDVDIKNLTLEGAKAIYFADYWVRPGFSRIDNHELSIKVFNLGVNIGTKKISMFLQEATNLFDSGLKIDGVIGEKTIEWLNKFKHPKAMISALEIIVGLYYIGLGQKRFLAGWLIRLDT
jgi:lysozyme family protein